MQEDELFRRDGFDVHLDVPLTVSQAILGTTVKVPTLREGEIELQVPPGTQPDATRVLRGKGIQKPNTSVYGNQILHFKVMIPTCVALCALFPLLRLYPPAHTLLRSLTPKQQSLIQEFAKEETEPVAKKSFFKVCFPPSPPV